MFSRFNKLWKDHGFELTLVFCLVFIIGFGVYRNITRQKGTWSKQNYTAYPHYQRRSVPPAKRQPSTESKGETECRRVLQHLFKRRFDKARPDFLRNPVTGGNFNLELDCFDSDMKLAVEYNGVQHYKYVPYFHRNKEAFQNQKYRDFMKEQLCKTAGVTLISVPYTVDVGQIKGYLESALRRSGFRI